MADHHENAEGSADDMAEYLQTFLDETEEQLDDLVETMLALESDATSKEDLNEAFRLIHSIKGSAGMMGFDNITVLTHHLENRFERFRAETERLDEPTMNVVLRCIDFLRQCNNRLRVGEPLGSSVELLDEVKRMEEQAVASGEEEPEGSPGDQPGHDDQAADLPSSPSPDSPTAGDGIIRMVVRFRAALQLADLKAQLIVARLAGFGEVKSTHPDLDHLADGEPLDEFEVRMETEKDLASLRAVADVDGVESIEFPGAKAESVDPSPVEEGSSGAAPDSRDGPQGTPTLQEHPAEENNVPTDGPADENQRSDEQVVTVEQEDDPSESAIAEPQHTESSEPVVAEKPAAKVAETMRVDIDRLDNLMNLAGELVVNRARFVQISGQISPALRKTSLVGRVREFSEGLRRTIESLEGTDDVASDRSAQIQQLRSGLELMNEQSEVWENGHHCFNEISEAIDQLSRVSHSLQRGVLDTRMVPVGPLFNRFKRVVRDLSKDRGKMVHLLIRGEKTELDKRMIDELGDPLVHLIRNSIDHGLEAPDVRVGRGKPEAGTICLEASHSGNNVTIHVRDDGAGIDVDKIKAKLIENRILSASAVDELSDEQILDYIWHPGFSTAKEVTDVSGRGVGMDVVKTRIGLLNGTIEVDSGPQRGATFTLRLPLTLAIIDCLLVRMRGVVFSMPIDDVCEIVSVKQSDVVTVQGKQTFDVRDEFIPLVGIDDVFHWHGVGYGSKRAEAVRSSDSRGPVNVVILQIAGKTMGLQVDELLGSQDVVIKSLSDNFINIRGLSGASILGDGSVCLMLDVGTMIDMATKPSRTTTTEGAIT